MSATSSAAATKFPPTAAGSSVATAMNALAASFYTGLNGSATAALPFSTSLCFFLSWSERFRSCGASLLNLLGNFTSAPSTLAHLAPYLVKPGDMTLEGPSINYSRRLSFDRNNNGRASAPQLPRPQTIEPVQPIRPVEPMSQTVQK